MSGKLSFELPPKKRREVSFDPINNKEILKEKKRTRVNKNIQKIYPLQIHQQIFAVFFFKEKRERAFNFRRYYRFSLTDSKGK